MVNFHKHNADHHLQLQKIQTDTLTNSPSPLPSPLRLFTTGTDFPVYPRFHIKFTS